MLYYKKSAIADFSSVCSKTNEVYSVAVSYKKPWKLLIDRDMKKKGLCTAAGISHASVAKLGKDENVTTYILVKICSARQCDIVTLRK